MRIIAIIQCRYGSSRLPGKALKKLGHTTVLGHVIDRAKHIQGVDKVVVATGPHTTNYLIGKEAMGHNIDVYYHEGEENDVLKRLLLCAIEYNAEYVLRICGDSPFLDVTWAEELIKEINYYDYIAHYLKDDRFPTVDQYAWGCQSELVKTKALFRLHYHCPYDELREHPTMGIYKDPVNYAIKKVPVLTIPTTISIDTEQDLRWAQKIIKES